MIKPITWKKFLGEHQFAVDGCAIQFRKKTNRQQWYNGFIVRWLDGDDNKDEDEDKDDNDYLFFDITSNLVVGCIPVREGRGVFSMMIK